MDNSISDRFLKLVKSKPFINSLKLLLGIVVIGNLIFSGKLDPKNVASALASPMLALYLLIVGILFSVLKGYRLQLVLRLGGAKISFAQSCQLTFLAYFFDLCGIGHAGGMAAKFIYIKNFTKQKKIWIAALLGLEVCIVTYALFILTVLSVFCLYLHKQMNQTSFMIAVVSCFGVIVPLICFKAIMKFNPSEGSRFYSLFQKFEIAKSNPGLTGKIIAVSLIVLLIKVFSLWIGAQYLNPDLGLRFDELAAIFSIGAYVSILPFGVAGAGPGHLGYQLVWENIRSVSNSFGADLYTLFWYQNLLLAGVGLLYLFRTQQKTRT